jgi:oligoendopeptidase F
MTDKKRGFDYRAARSLPPLKKYRTEWDLKGLYYKSGRDPRIEADLKATETAYRAFAKKWSGDTFEKVSDLKQALAEYESLAGMPEIARPGRYFSFRKCLDVNDNEADRALALMSKRLRKASDQLLFFTLKLGKLPETLQKEYLQAKDLAHFRYYLERIFSGAKHDLTEAEEKIVRLKSRQSSGMWFDAVEKIISNRKVRFKDKELHLPEAIETIDLLPVKDRIKLWDLIIAEMKQIGEMAEHEMNAIVSDARGEDEIRGFKKPYSATALSYEHDEKSIENLVKAVSTKGFKLSQKFYKLKAKYHGVKELHYTEKYRSIGPELSISFEEAMEACRDVFYGLKTEYGEIFDRMLQNGQIDVFPRKGKRGGAFMSEEVGHPTHVFLNHVPNFKSLETLAHEMGHAIHAHRSAVNSPFYQGFSIVTAETASTLFENLVFDAVYNQASEKDKATLLHDRITRDISTIERQIAFFNAELEMHDTIHAHGSMQNHEFAACMEKHLKSYLGPSVRVAKEDGYSYVYVSHLRYGFYVYSYAFGLLMSTLMSQKYKEDKSYIEKIDKFLSAGSSDTVVDIFKSIGIDTTKEDTFLKALDNHAADIKQFEKIVKLR